MNPKLRSRLLKLLALTASSNQHEAANAQSRIDALCAKHNVNMDDLLDETEQVSMHWFRYDDKNSKAVLLNTIWRATDILDTWQCASKQRQVGVKCTRSQAAEIQLWWSVMRQAFKQHMEDSTNAFIIANKLFGETSPEGTEDGDFDLDAWERRYAMADSIEPTPVMRGIEHKG